MEPSQFDEINEKWRALQVAVEELAEIFHSLVAPWITEVIQTIRSVYIQLRRAQLYFDLSRRWWIPSWLAVQLSIWYPERWLPELRFNEPEAMKGATEVDGDQELSPSANLDEFWCTNCGDHFYTGIQLEPTAVTCPFCQSDKVRVRQ